MRLAAVDDLKASPLPRDALEPRHIPQQQIPALVERGPAGEADRERLAVESDVCAPVHKVQQQPLRGKMGAP